MITRIEAKDNYPSWQLELSQAITDPKTLFQRLRLDPATLPAAYSADQLFGLRVTESYLNNIEPGNPLDPLLLQVLPLGAETQQQPVEFSDDPVGDEEATQSPGTLHKYHGRVLLIATQACAIHCRYCFRRHFPYSDSTASRSRWSTALEYIQSDASIDEVILSGGDPLSLADEKLRSLLIALENIPHVKRLRVHTRFPLVLPSRITSELVKLLTGTRLKAIMVIHSNHPNEISEDVRSALKMLTAAQIPLLNQSVLLNGINNDINTLETLSKLLFEENVLPYYLHILDKVNGAAHFDVDESTAKILVRDLQKRLPGYLVPRLVKEESGESSKTLILPH